MTTRNILIVDDEPKVAFFLGKTLEHADQTYRVSIAHSGEEALEMFEHSSISSIDLLITDLRMPGISGLELLRWVRTSSPKTRTILITAYGSDEVETEARHLEAYRYITKPFNISDFTQVVESALRDGVISRPGLVIFSGESFETIAQHLESLRHDIGARCILLANMQGQQLTEVGNTQGLDVTTLLALLAGGFVATGELAQQFGDGKAINLNFHEGSHYDVYSANVGDTLFLAILYDRRVQASRIGIVWLYMRRVIEDLLSILSNMETSAPEEVLDADFSSSLMTELDTLFTEEAVPVEEKPTSAPALRTARMARQGAPAVETVEKKHSGGEKPRPELLDLEAAIAQGLIPAELIGGSREA